MSTPVDRQRLLRALGFAALALLTLHFAAIAVDLALHKVFTIDEFQYAHASWAIGRGEVPYRDFFEPHFPLVYQSLAPIWFFVDDDPRNIVLLRGGMLVYLALGLWAAFTLSLRRGRPVWLALLGPLFLLACKPFVVFAAEIRHDPAAASLFLAAIAALSLRRAPVWGRAALSGAFLALACWATQKAFFYGLPFAAALLADVVSRGRRPPMLGDPRAFLGGVALVVAPIALWLSVTGTWGPWWRWCITWASEYQSRYTELGWMEHLDAILRESWWMVAAAAIGAVTILRREARAAPEEASPADQLLVAGLFTSFLSVSVQQAPWSYAFAPFIVVVAVLAARGVASVIEAVRPDRGIGRVWVAATLGLGLGLGLARSSAGLRDLAEKRTNTYQLTVLAQIHRLTAPDDVFYDNSGSYVSRPHAYFFFETWNDIRRHEARRLSEEVPAALRDRGVVAVFEDARADDLPKKVKAYVELNFQRYSVDLRLWGRRLENLHGVVEVPKDGRYFIEPAEAIEGGMIKIDGEVVRTQIVELTRGEHRFTNRRPSESTYLLWLPRDGATWRPLLKGRPRFSIHFL